MNPYFDDTRKLAARIVAAVVPMAQFAEGDSGRLGDFQDHAEQALAAYETIVSSVPPGAARVAPDLGKIIRVAVAFFTLADLIGATTGAGGSWCEQLAQRTAPWTLALPRTSRPTRDEDTAMILPELADDFLDAADGVIYLDSTRAKAMIAVQLDRICGTFGVTRGNFAHTPLTAFQRGEVARRLGISPYKVDRMRRRNQLVWMKTWTGAYRYPTFQFHGDELCSVVKQVLPNMILDGWPRALFLL
ncbi:MAG: hypothetical protein LBU05_04955, partial [Bifidobacteriaceae bacterium]|nr:hypothetical protein [Bifidobacteriaceae bacterium]